MPVDHTFEIPGRGTVVVGTIEAGAVVVGESLSISEQVVTCRAIERYRDLLSSAVAGDSVGILLDGVAESDVAAQVLRSS